MLATRMKDMKTKGMREVSKQFSPKEEEFIRSTYRTCLRSKAKAPMEEGSGMITSTIWLASKQIETLEPNSGKSTT